MDRRTYLRSLGVGGLAGVAGCLERVGLADDGDGSDENGGGLTKREGTILGPPDERRGDPSYPIYGEEFPDFSLPDPLDGESVSRDDLVGDRAFLMTYFFTSCPDGACPALLLRLRRVQEDAIENGYADNIALLAVTFDPERDTPEVIETYAGERGIDYEADNWHFLRPESYEAGTDLIENTFGMPIQRVEEGEEGENEGNESSDDHENNESGGDHEGNESSDGHDHGEYTFQHYNLITLVNADGIVERAYPNAVDQREEVSVETIREDARTVAQE